jgi:5-methylcytosine-specific restriction endonuclease McrA
MEDEFSAPRTSFRVPIPELETAADLLGLAADSLLACDEKKARSYLEQANMPALRIYMRSIASQVTREIHRFRDVPGLAVAIPMSMRGPRQPSSATALEIYHRDGFRCRYCGCRIVFPQAESVISTFVPGAVRWGTKDNELNAAFYTLKGVLDHIEPHAHGGSSDPENLVVTCQPCNYGKGNWFIQQLGLSDPRLRPPQVGNWDGLLRVLPLRAARVKPITEVTGLLNTVGRTLPPNGNTSIDDFSSAFSAADRQHLNVLLQVIRSCGDLGVFWKVGRVLLANIRVNDIALSALGVEANTTIQIPWSVGSYKRAFRPFAEILAAALPDATVYETEKMWRVRYLGRFPRISDLMQKPEAVRAAFNALHRSLTNPTN